jgi:hypothetical protein
LFVQAPRTGCTAIARLLKDRFGGEQFPPEDILDANGYFKVPRKHCSVPQLVEHGLLPPDYASTLVVFVAVRNPYDSLASLYVKKREKYQPLLADRSSWIYRVKGYVEDMEFCRTHTFEEWLAKHYHVSPVDKLMGRGRRSLYGRYTRGVQRVIRFERLQQDFEAVMRAAGVTGDVTIPSVNSTPQRKASYQDYYTPAAKRLVDYVFRSDLADYGYSFDGIAEPAAMTRAEAGAAHD